MNTVFLCGFGMVVMDFGERHEVVEVLRIAMMKELGISRIEL